MGPPELPGGNALLNDRTLIPNAASMGPPELPGGNSTLTMRSVWCAVQLQWGRRNYPAETLG